MLPKIQARSTHRRGADAFGASKRRASLVRPTTSCCFPTKLRTSLRALSFRAEVVPLNSLCIAKGKAVWVLYVDAICINYDGNAFDAALLAIVAALQDGEVSFSSLCEICFRLID